LKCRRCMVTVSPGRYATTDDRVPQKLPKKFRWVVSKVGRLGTYKNVLRATVLTGQNGDHPTADASTPTATEAVVPGRHDCASPSTSTTVHIPPCATRFFLSYKTADFPNDLSGFRQLLREPIIDSIENSDDRESNHMAIDRAKRPPPTPRHLPPPRQSHQSRYHRRLRSRRRMPRTPSLQDDTTAFRTVAVLDTADDTMSYRPGVGHSSFIEI